MVRGDVCVAIDFDAVTLDCDLHRAARYVPHPLFDV